MQSSGFFRGGFFALFLLFAMGSCTKHAVSDEEFAVDIPTVSASKPVPVLGFVNPRQPDIWLEYSGQKGDFRVLPGSPELEVSMDLREGMLFFRAPHLIRLLEVWDDKGVCAAGFKEGRLSREYNYWVIEAALSPDFFQCLLERHSGFFFRVEMHR